MTPDFETKAFFLKFKEKYVPERSTKKYLYDQGTMKYLEPDLFLHTT